VLGSESVSSSSDSDSDTTRLWYMRLGHMSEKGMVKLSERGLLCGQKTGKLDFVKIVFLENKNELSLTLLFTRPKKRWIISIRIFEALHKFPLLTILCIY
jgi:hypothetical protein